MAGPTPTLYPSTGRRVVAEDVVDAGVAIVAGPVAVDESAPSRMTVAPIGAPWPPGAGSVALVAGSAVPVAWRLGVFAGVLALDLVIFNETVATCRHTKKSDLRNESNWR